MAMTIFIVLSTVGVIFLIGVFVSLCRAGDGKSAREVMTIERQEFIVDLPDTTFARPIAISETSAGTARRSRPTLVVRAS